MSSAIPLPAPNRFGLPHLGVGVGLRTVHFSHILSEWPAVDWFEIISENFLDTEGRAMWVLERIAERYPIVMHGVSLSIGSTDPLDIEYLKKLKALAKRVDAKWVSDHVCWTGVARTNMHDLLPIPTTDEALQHVIGRIKTVQDVLERPIALENPSSYVEFVGDVLPEAEFIASMAVEADCMLLLDVNNVYVSAFNHGFDAAAYLAALPMDRVAQFHLAGHTNYGTHILDTHSDHVIDEVWQLYRTADALTGGRSTLLEWDENIPDFDVVHAEALKAREFVAVPTSPEISGAPHV